MCYSPVERKKTKKRNTSWTPYPQEDRLRARTLVSQVKKRSQQEENPLLYTKFKIHLNEYTYCR